MRSSMLRTPPSTYFSRLLAARFSSSVIDLDARCVFDPALDVFYRFASCFLVSKPFARGGTWFLLFCFFSFLSSSLFRAPPPFHSYLALQFCFLSPKDCSNGSRRMRGADEISCGLFINIFFLLFCTNFILGTSALNTCKPRSRLCNAVSPLF